MPEPSEDTRYVPTKESIEFVDKQVAKLLPSIHSESDRGLVTVALSIIEELLSGLIDRRLKSPAGGKKKDWNPAKAPGKVLAEHCFRLGLLNEEMLYVLRGLFEFRNSLSHSHIEFSFDNPSGEPNRALNEIFQMNRDSLADSKFPWHAMFVSWDVLFLCPSIEKITNEVLLPQGMRGVYTLLLACHISSLAGILFETKTVDDNWVYCRYDRENFINRLKELARDGKAREIVVVKRKTRKS